MASGPWHAVARVDIASHLGHAIWHRIPIFNTKDLRSWVRKRAPKSHQRLHAKAAPMNKFAASVKVFPHPLHEHLPSLVDPDSLLPHETKIPYSRLPKTRGSSG